MAIEFDVHRATARKDLIDFVNEHVSFDIVPEIGREPEKWVEELGMINLALTGDSLVRSAGIHAPPLEDSNFVKIGENIYLYRKGERRLQGIWERGGEGTHTKEQYDEFPGGSPWQERLGWRQTGLGALAVLRMNKEFSGLEHEIFLPERFESIAEKVVEVKDGRELRQKRPIWKFDVQHDGEQMIVYAKGCDFAISFYHEPAWFRLTPFAGIQRTTSKKEMETTIALAELGASVPRVVGYYKSPYEEFLFLEGLKGESPLEHLANHRKTIIEQDAHMLAALCLGGFRKIGFTDFDDKVFDNETGKLSLIDVDECRDLYWTAVPKYRDILLDPRDTRGLRKFRGMQRNIFRKMLQDAVYNYRRDLTPSFEDQRAYVEAFHDALKWKRPGDAKMKRFLDFPKDYQTFDSWISMMMDTD